MDDLCVGAAGMAPPQRPVRMFSDDCPPFGTLMRLAGGSSPEPHERQHLSSRCLYCEMTLRQAFLLVCPDRAALDQVTSIRGALLVAVTNHLENDCSDCGSGGGIRPTGAIEVASTVGLRRRPVQARARQRIEAVLDAAEAVFVEVGYTAATTNMIAARAETSIGSIYEFFGNKQAVAKALGDRYLRELTALYHEVVADDPGGREVIVSNVVDGLAGFSARHPGLRPLLRGCRDCPDLQAVGDLLEAVLLDHVERVLTVRRQDLDPGRRHIVATICIGVLRSLDDVKLNSEEEHAALLAEIKLNLSAYLAAALPRSSPSELPAS